MSTERNPGTLSSVTLSIRDVDRCLTLSNAAGWNQTNEDWRFQVRMGKAIGLEDSEGRLIATGVTLPVSSGVDWIAMILVEESWRGRGVGRRVMETLVVDDPHLCFALDATEFGLPLYESLGFMPIERIQRLHLERDGRFDTTTRVPPRASWPFDGIAKELSNRDDVNVVTSGTAYGLVRPGRQAAHLGPILAESEFDAYRLVREVVDTIPSGILIDVPSRAGTFSRRLETAGFVTKRSFVRMAKGCSVFAPPGSFAIAGPEYS